MSKISCKLRNSFALDANGNLFSWGSWQSGLLGSTIEADMVRPNIIEIKNGRDKYNIQKVSAGHFHVAVVANRERSTKPKEFKYANNLFDDLKEWFSEVFVKNIITPISFLKFILKKTQQTKDAIKYEELEKLFLQPFFSYLKLNNKDIFMMNKVYEEIIYEEFGLSSKKLTFNPIELNKIADSNNLHLKEAFNFAKYIVDHFLKNPEDFPFFIRLIMRFEKFVKQSDMINLFEYVYASESKISIKSIETNKPKIIQLFNDLKRPNEDKKDEFVVDINELIDSVLRVQTGLGVVFTWGVSSECRLGYAIEDKEKDSSKSGSELKKKDDKEVEEEIRIQRIPKIVYFKNVFIKIKKVSCGYSHNLALSSENQVYSWGSGKYGCLGNFKSDNILTPELVEKDSEKKNFGDIVDIAAGMYFSMALTNDGKVYSWGCGSGGRLGQGNENSVGNPKVINFFLFENIKISQISCGDTNGASLSTSKELYTWGNGNFGKLGHGNYDDVKTPLLVQFFNKNKIEQVVCGSHNSIAVLNDNRIFAWGKNSHGMLGIPQQVDENILIPAEVMLQKDEHDSVVSDISLGSMHSMFLCSNGSVYTCGNSINGILAHPEIFDKVNYPKKIPDVKFFETSRKDILIDSIFKDYNPEFTLNIDRTKYANSMIFSACSNFNTAFITNNGDLYMCGESSLIPEESEESKRDEGEETQRALKKNGMVTEDIWHLWKDRLMKISVPSLNEKVSFIAMSSNHVICIADKKAYSWGKNVYGILGQTNKLINEVVQYPTLIEKITTSVKMAAVSETHSLILTTNGEIFAWGSNLYGKLGVGDLNKYFQFNDTYDVPFEMEPQLVKNITYADYIDCSNNHSACIMKYDQNFASSYMVFTWGSGFQGKLGHEDGGDSFEPKKVEQLEVKSKEEDTKLYFVKLALGDEFTLALDLNGTLWGWGKKKYLVMSKEEIDEGYFTSPQCIFSDTKFKYITSSANMCIAIDIFDQLHTWGKLTLGGKTTIKQKEKIYCDKMSIVSCGYNHFCAIEKSFYSPYTWGSNLFFKCGQNVMDGRGEKVSDENSFQLNPRKIEFFFDLFTKSNAAIESEYENQNKMAFKINNEGSNHNTNNNKSEKKYQKSNEIQLKLLDEQLEKKNLGLLGNDYKINQKFYENLGEFFNKIKAIEENRMKCTMNTENKIISIINESKTLKNDVYRSDVPKILIQNFQLFEAALGLIQMHPCYLHKAYLSYNNKSMFIDLVKMVFGRNYINMRNKRVSCMLLGLWNALFLEESKEDSTINLRTSDRFEDFITYDLYDLIFKINKENDQIIYDITSEVFLYFIIEVITRENVVPSNDQEFLSRYKDFNNEVKKEICTGAVKIIAERIAFLFTEMNESLKNNFTISVIWIFKKISKIFKTQKEVKIKKDKNKDKDNDKNSEKSLVTQFNRVFNYFLFIPFVGLLKTIRESHDESQCVEYKMFVKRIPIVLEKLKNKQGYSQLYNLYKNDKQSIENSFFKIVCSTKSEILKQTFDLFSILSKKDISDSIISNGMGMIDKMNLTCKHALQEFQYDFTMSALKELLKSNCEIGNEIVIVPMSVQDIINFRECLNKINQNIPADDLAHDPLRPIITYINEFKIDDLDSNSNIRNFIINFYIKPNSLIYNTSLGDPKILKCKDCLLPIHHVFFSNQTLLDFTEWTEWTCKPCGNSNKTTTNEKHLVQCKSCNKPKPSSFIKNSKSFFRLFSIPNEDEETLIFEDVLYNLHPVSENDDVMSEINTSLDKLRSVKSKDNGKFKFELFQKFLNIINLKVGNSEDYLKADAVKKEIIKKLFARVVINYKKRTKHHTYLTSINEFAFFLVSSSESAKSNFNYVKKQNELYSFNVKRGYANDWAKINGSLTKILKSKNEKSESEKNIIKKFLVVHLIKMKVIDEILFQNQKQPKMTQKSYLLFEKEEKGYTIKLNYKEIFRRFIICGVNTHEYILEEHSLPNEAILEMRKNVRNNPTLNLGDIRFNIFYLVKLLNSLETLN